MSRQQTRNNCILCGRCMEVCPVFEITNLEEMSPRGRSYLLDKGSEHGVQLQDIINASRTCVGCGRCSRICPRGINLPEELSILKSSRPDWKIWFASRILRSNPKLLASAAKVQHILPGSLPLLPAESHAPATELLVLQDALQKQSGRAAVFPGCAARSLMPGLEKKALRILSSCGFEIADIHDWRCCGLPLSSAGLPGPAVKDLEHNLALWQNAGQPRIFTFCASCTHGLKNTALSPHDLSLGQKFKEAVFPLSSLLPSLHFVGNLSEDESLYWHQPCHGHKSTPAIFYSIFQQAGIYLNILDNQCCGMGGFFAMINSGLSAAIATRFMDKFKNTYKARVLADCNGCALQLANHAPANIISDHWLEAIKI